MICAVAHCVLLCYRSDGVLWWVGCLCETRRLEVFALSTMDSDHRLIQVISAMRWEIRKLELENMGLRRRAGPNLRKNATVPIMTTGCRGTIQNPLVYY